MQAAPPGHGQNDVQMQVLAHTAGEERRGMHAESIKNKEVEIIPYKI